MLKVISYQNKEDGLESAVWQFGAKFHVTLKDTDADKTLPQVSIFTERVKAIEYAKSLVAA